MPLIQPDTTAAQGMEPVPPGTYQAKIIGCEFQNSKKGNPMIVPSFEFFTDGQRRVRKSYVPITGAGAFNFDSLLRATGFHELADKYKDKNLNPKPPFDTDMLRDQELQVVVEETIYEGQKRDQVTGYLPK